MTLLKDVTDCSTYSVRGLDNQLIAQMNKIRPNLLVRIDSLNVELGQAVHPWMQAAAKKCLERAIAARGQQMIINSAYRTIAAQMLLFLQYKTGRCGITAASPPGNSNHNNASAIDIEDPYGWRSALESNGWRKLGDWDRMHYDCVDNNIQSIKEISVQAFQQLWSMSRPNDKLADDGDYGPATSSRLLYAPAEGFPGVGIPRVLKLTEPLQIGNDVGELQLALRKAGIDIDKADKVFGTGTDLAVKEFQTAKNMVADGIVGSGTRKALGLE
ncbi:Peptidoglycan-binding domain 1 protein [Crinalium epipsammum PCC 9333]|uniref:Peptidoglycan-binding domain 1 protein n=1 Tax=Crinalium epipsammum PCC 9333 TaxID=1173022 RepID=K9W132_9CYAN|nr:peptidoglycan-binding protein [Crinalium epipsammum]AFZ13125.1 Peptidoglycan-binding domain 1 protein [Crinalium epipsammum PCC 9333]